MTQNSDVTLQVEAMTVDAMVEGVARDDYEIAIAHNSVPHPALRAVHTRPLPIDLLAASDHSLARRGAVAR